MDAKPDVVCKFIVIGDQGTGKTTILHSYAFNRFASHVDPTLGIDFKVKNINLEGKHMKIQLLDSPGHGRFRAYTKSYFGDMDAVVLCYSIIDRASFECVKGWISEVRSVNANLPMVLIGNKLDCSEQRAVMQLEGMNLSAEQNIPFYEVSAKRCEFVEDAFMSISRLVHDGKFRGQKKLEAESRHFQHHAVELEVRGAKSWFNKNKINGRYLPCGSKEGDQAATAAINTQSDANRCYYKNLDTIDTIMVYESNQWVIKKHKKVLASLPTSSVKCLPNVASQHAEWQENFGVYFTRLHYQPELKCIALDVATSSAPRADAFDVQTQRGSINMDLYAELSKEPERMGLTVPLFVKYSRVKVAILELEFKALSDSSEEGLKQMELISAQRQDITRTCKHLLRSLSLPESTDELAVTPVAVANAIESLLAELNVHFEKLSDLDSGNFEVARRCRETQQELRTALQKLRPSEPKKTAPRKDADQSSSDTSKETVGAALSSDLTEVNTRTGALVSKVVRDPKQRWTCTVDSVGWQTVHERENRTAAEIEWRCTVAIGLTNSTSTSIGAALSGGMGTICAQLSLDAQWTSAASKCTEHAHILKIPPNTKLIVDQEVIEGHFTLEKKKGALGLSPLKAPKPEHFKVAKDSLRMRSLPL
jgi:small GTP-binding protein